MYLKQVRDIAYWSEKYGCKGILIYTDNSLVDPWLVAQVVIENTNSLFPLVAVQPVYRHPYTVAKMVSTFAYLYDRRIFLNMVAGGFVNDLRALNDYTPHDTRYTRLVEYTKIIKNLLAGDAPVSFDGEFYNVNNLKLTPQIPDELEPGIFLSGSSDAGLAAARALNATAIMYPKPVDEYAQSYSHLDGGFGIRIGIIARECEETAWAVAHDRFPVDRAGQLTHELAMKTSDSEWHKQLSGLAREAELELNPYWLIPFENYKTFCPYLVGSYERVAGELRGYIEAGATVFIMDIPTCDEDLLHIRRCFDLAEG